LNSSIFPAIDRTSDVQILVWRTRPSCDDPGSDVPYISRFAPILETE
jgi:hypothetical protein